MALFCIVTFYLGLYAYKNPDPKSCWVVRDLHTTATSKADVIARANTMGIDITEGYPIEMHTIYIVWFTWGFYAHLAFSVLFLATLVVGYFKNSYGWILGSCNCVLSLVNLLIWLSFGAIWRFSSAGVVAAGDKLERLFGTTDEIWQ